MAGYEDTRQKIISTLMGRPVGTEIQPENHQDYALNMLDYIRSLELIATSTLIGVAESNTTPVQPNASRVCYIAGVAQNQTVTFENFIGENGNPISVTTGDMEGVFVILMWNTQYWSAQTFSTNIISQYESATFYYRYNIRKTYESIALMNADVVSPIGTDGKYIKVGDIVTVVNSTTPSENGIYSYEGTTDGWKYQSSFNFQLEQIRSQNTNTAPSSKLFDDNINELASDIVQVETDLNALEQEQIQGGVYDVSSHNDGAVFESLSALLGSANLSTLIPTSVRRGGMSIRFVQSSDNKYAQYRYMESDAATVATFTNPNNWQDINIERINNEIISADFSNLSNWTSNKMSDVSVSDGVATITYDNNQTYLKQFIAYTSGEYIYAEIECKCATNNANYSPSVVLGLYDDQKALINRAYVNNASKTSNGRKDVIYITKEDIAAIEVEETKTVAYISLGLEYVGSYFAQGTASIEHPLVLLSDNDIDSECQNVANLTSYYAITIKGIQLGHVAGKDKEVGAYNYNSLTRSYMQYLSVAAASISRFTLNDNIIKQISSTGSNFISIGDVISDITTEDKIFVAMRVKTINNSQGITIIPTVRCNNDSVTPNMSKSISVVGNGTYYVGVYIAFNDKYEEGHVAMLDNTNYDVYPAISVDGMVVNSTELTIEEARVYVNPLWIDNDSPNALAQWLFGENTESVVHNAYLSMNSNTANTAKELEGITLIFRGKKLITIGDSITYQNTWQEHIARQFGMRYDINEVINGTQFINISNGNAYDTGLTYDSVKKCYVDDNGVRYYASISAGSGSVITYKRYDNGQIYKRHDNGKTYNYGLKPDRNYYPKYYLDQQNNKYLPTVLAYGGQPMRVTGDANLSMYEMSFFAKYYNPDIVILTGGTNDPNSTYGTADDPICELTLEQCQGMITNVTVCSAVKGAIKRIMTDCPNALIFLAMPVRKGSLPDNTKDARLNLMQQYKQIAYDMGVGFIDWNSGTGITDYNLTECFKDGIHPNSYGGWLMARKAIADML